MFVSKTQFLCIINSCDIMHFNRDALENNLLSYQYEFCPDKLAPAINQVLCYFCTAENETILKIPSVFIEIQPVLLVRRFRISCCGKQPIWFSRLASYSLQI